MFFFNDIQPIGNNTENSFDSIKQIDANGNECTRFTSYFRIYKMG